ncbi:hypothetical protein C1645_751346 [Glomus cerebriforme]|uniref:Secreted protein n=1 Tax=Glomus cerebriforme TaxID=658196 RepID=A0A397TSH1_9GLOM|nr:hypothetical protein C1645_751346 [Glomus cerebriforme]
MSQQFFLSLFNLLVLVFCCPSFCPPFYSPFVVPTKMYFTVQCSFHGFYNLFKLVPLCKISLHNIKQNCCPHTW